MTVALSPENLRASRIYHQKREAKRRIEREALRQERLEATRSAILKLAPLEPSLRAVYLFGSILRPGCFGRRSDIDIAVDSDDPAAESRLWQALEANLDVPFDVRTRSGAIAKAVEHRGEQIYARKSPDSRAKHR